MIEVLLVDPVNILEFDSLDTLLALLELLKVEVAVFVREVLTLDALTYNLHISVVHL